MKNNLWAYGCSWTHYIDHEKEYNLKFWPELLSEKIGYNFINNGFGGQSNFESSIKLFRQLNQIKKDDLVVFQFTYPDRFPLPFVNKNEISPTWNNHDISEIRHVMFDFTYHEVDYFLNEKFYNSDKIQKYMDFVLTYRLELLLLAFKNIVPIFDYIENAVGAKVKYWFINPVIYNSDKNLTDEQADNVKKILSNPSRIVRFPTNDDHLNIDAQRFIILNRLRYSDTYQDYDEKFQKKLMEDYHPNDNGQKNICEKIYDSLNKKIF